MNLSAGNTEDSKRLITHLYDAAVTGDFAGVNALIDDETRFHEPACLPYGGSYQGRDKLIGLFATVAGYLDFSTIKIDYILADGEDVITSLRIRTRKRGLEIRILEQAVVRKGKIVDLRIFPFDPTQIMADKQ